MKPFVIFFVAAAAILAGAYLVFGRNQPKTVMGEKLETLVARADRGDAAASLELGVRYGFGFRGLEQDWTQARHWTAKAAEAGSAEAKVALAAMGAKGLGGVSEAGTGMKALEEAADAGSAEAAYAFGWMQMEAGKRAEGFARLRKSAKAGFYRAQYRMGLLYLKGAEDLGIEDPDEGEAMRWLELAAKQADSDACGELGRCYLRNGADWKLGYSEAYAWLYAATDADKRWEPLRVEAKRRLSGWEERDYEQAVTFSRREYGPKRFHASLAAKAAEEKGVF